MGGSRLSLGCPSPTQSLPVPSPGKRGTHHPVKPCLPSREHIDSTPSFFTGPQQDLPLVSCGSPVPPKPQEQLAYSASARPEEGGSGGSLVRGHWEGHQALQTPTGLLGMRAANVIDDMLVLRGCCRKPPQARCRQGCAPSEASRERNVPFLF